MKMLGVLALIGFIGFLLGIAAKFVQSDVLPILSGLFPQIMSVAWVGWGVGGAILSVVGCLLYAYLT